MTILFSQSIQGQSPSIHILHKFTEGMISSQKLSNDCLLCQASHMNLGARKMAEQDYCNREVKKRGAVRQQSGYVSKWSSHWALMMEDTASNLAWAYKYSWVCSLCKCCDYVIRITSKAPLFAKLLITRTFKFPGHVKIIIWEGCDPQSKLVCVPQWAHSQPNGLMTRVAMGTARLCLG